MWFQVLPSFAIVIGFMAAPQIITYVTNSLFLGNAFRRRLFTYDDAHNYLRDMRISGRNDPYYQVGLECLKDEDEDSQSKGQATGQTKGSNC